MEAESLATLEAFLLQIPALKPPISKGYHVEGLWWVKFQLDIRHRLAWQVVQEIGCVANYLSLNERLPTVFYPVSPPPYLNGGPQEYLSWVMENSDKNFSPGKMREWLEGRMPSPVDDEAEWLIDADEVE